jgi:hypothetical protein
MTSVPHQSFIFLCGLHRSGTTPLFRILREHPQISGFQDTGVPEDEGQHLQNIYPPAKAFGGPGRFGFDRAAHLTETSELLTAESKQKLFEQWSKHWDLSREYLLEKSPPNLIRTRFLQACFPNSYFIVILRHPIAVSMATFKWSHCTLDSLMSHWVRCHRLFDSDRSRVRRLLVIRYEELISDSPRIFGHIGSFLGLRSPAQAELDPKGNQRYLEAWDRFTEEGDGRVLFRDLVAKYEKTVRDYGYSLIDCSKLLPSGRISQLASESNASQNSALIHS